MKIYKCFPAIFVTICVLLVACSSDKKETTPPSKPINIIVILDVSDRLFKEKLPGQERQAEKDIKIAKGIIEIFEKFARKYYFVGSRHRLAFVVPKQPGVSKPIPQKTLESLKIWPTPEDRVKGAKRFKEMKDELIKAIEDLYRFVDERQEFTGSDIWGWFKVSAKEYLLADARNYIICISDGYLYLNTAFVPFLPTEENKTTVIRHSLVEKWSNDPNWEADFEAGSYGLLPTEEDFRDYNAKFLMVEIGLPELRLKDLPILEKYWVPWLQTMGIPDPKFSHTQDDPGVVVEKIKGFLK